MDIEPIAPGHSADKVLAAWLAVRDALEAVTPPAADGPPTPLEGMADAIAGIQAEQELTVPVSEPVLPGADSDFSHEAATVQTAWRAPTPATDMPRADQAPTVPAAQSELAVPSSLLLAATLTGLRVEPAAGWAQLPPGPVQWQVARPERDRRRQPRQHREPPAHDEQPDAPPTAAPDQDESDAPDAVLDPTKGGAWCEALSQALRAALSARIVPQALHTAAEQWKRGRCVVLACPQGDDPAGPAWAFVLWPRVPARRAVDGVAPALALHGLQVEARLQWSAPPRPGQWCHVRVVKEHHPRTGRQLVSLEHAAAPSGRETVPCEVQLGPVLARSLRWCEVRVRIQAAQRFWGALGAQWSVHVVVSAQPLLVPTAANPGSSPC